MCTALSFATEDDTHFLARTMDFSFELEAQLIYIPREYEFSSLVAGTKYTTKYGFIGAGRDVDGYIFADGFNEKGFSIASLYFEKNAKYSTNNKEGALNVASTDMVSWALGNIATVAEFEKRYSELNVVEKINPLLQTQVPLHWIVADSLGKTGVLEITAQGAKFYQNEVGVMTNSPEFLWHMNNLNHYVNLQPTDFTSKKYGDYETVSDGPGSGALGLPGDYTSASRFIRTTFLKQYSDHSAGVKNGVNAVLHVLNSVDIPKGVKITSKNVVDYTQYKGIMDLNNLSYYFMAYTDTKLAEVKLTKQLLEQATISIF
ncbi:choloylglycine hydrolase family protein [Ligilactobacillus sp. WILCCON 0076]|uniref:Choloylglycine hydrolase family protein n=1 Tax=Ligilactobacillus ubinensis TaxID=2876789 RepID=A0A9X2JL26_9LACO|nr:choloylglycine hydrolase family protein [Ligilactobacillus ubinensis]MCP0886632.1 choloylglycine hydrolase family protein [Ligilactobacillus ubinensis]